MGHRGFDRSTRARDNYTLSKCLLLQFTVPARRTGDTWILDYDRSKTDMIPHLSIAYCLAALEALPILPCIQRYMGCIENPCLCISGPPLSTRAASLNLLSAS